MNTESIERIDYLVASLGSTGDVEAWREVRRLAELGALVEDTLNTVGDVALSFDGVSTYEARITTPSYEDDEAGRVLAGDGVLPEIAIRAALAAALTAKEPSHE